MTRRIETMTLENRIEKLEHQKEPRSRGRLTEAEWAWIRAERIRLLNDPKALDRLRNDALRADGLEPLPPRRNS